MVKITQITPEIAAQLLRGNLINRNISSATVDKYSRDLLAGNFRIGDSAICISKGGRLLNGQHRLLACIKAKTPFEAILRAECDEDEIVVMDRGKGRRFRDNLKISMSGDARQPVYTHPQVAPVARLIAFGGRKLGGSYSPSDAEVAEVISKHIVAFGCIKRLFDSCGHQNGDGIKALRNSNACLGILKAIESGVSYDIMQAFFDAVVYGYPTERSADLITDNRLKVAYKYREAHNRNLSKRSDLRNVELYTQAAISHFAANSNIKQLKPFAAYSIKGEQMTMEGV